MRRRLAVPALAAAAALFLFVHGRAPSSGWIVTDVVEQAGVGLEVGCGAPGEEVFAGRVDVGPASEFEIQLGRDLRLRMMPGTTVDLPSGPGRWFDRNRTLTVTSGEIYGTSADGGLGYRFRIQTPEAAGELLGTTFAAFRTPDGTCFCLLEGSLRVTPMTGRDAVDVVVGQRLFVYRDGRPLHMEPMTDMEQAKLTMMNDSGIVTPPPFPH